LKESKVTVYGIGTERDKMVLSKFPGAKFVNVNKAEGTRGARQARIESVLRGGEWPIIFDDNDEILTWP
jgi:hypothetical protein